MVDETAMKYGLNVGERNTNVTILRYICINNNRVVCEVVGKEPGLNLIKKARITCYAKVDECRFSLPTAFKNVAGFSLGRKASPCGWGQVPRGNSLTLI